jgi:hypothetical protein
LACGLFYWADIDIWFSLLKLLPAVFQREESVPGLPILVILEKLRWGDDRVIRNGSRGSDGRWTAKKWNQFAFRGLQSD